MDNHCPCFWDRWQPPTYAPLCISTTVSPAHPDELLLYLAPATSSIKSAVSNKWLALLAIPLDQVGKPSFLAAMHTLKDTAICGQRFVLYPVVCSWWWLLTRPNIWPEVCLIGGIILRQVEPPCVSSGWYFIARLRYVLLTAASSTSLSTPRTSQ